MLTLRQLQKLETSSHAATVCSSLQGLIPRVTSLAQLGGSVFLAFLPAVFFISLVFSAIYFVSLASDPQ